MSPRQARLAGTVLVFGLGSAGAARAAPEDDIEIEDPEPPPETSVPGTVPPGDPPPAEVPPPEPAPDPDVVRLRAEVAALEGRLSALENPPPPPPPPEPPPPPPRPPPWWEVADLRVSGFLQTQYEHHAISEDEITPDARPLNADRFLVRRGRIRVDRFWKYAHAAIEIDANTQRGPFLSLRRAEVDVFSPRDGDPLQLDPLKPPPLVVSAGLGEIPFGYELRWGNRDRPWMERTTGSLAFFRGEPDVGVRAWGGLGPVRYALAVQNGVPLDDRPGAVTDVFVGRPTFVGRVGLEERNDDFELGVGVSALDGKGFHAGQQETKAQLGWRDANQNGLVSLDELVPEPGQAATASIVFDRWGVNADVEGGVHTPIGWARVFGEVTIASNLDRSWFVADPISSGYDQRETAWTVSGLQELGDHALAGFRADHYDPDADFFEARRGGFPQVNVSITTLSPLAGFQIRDRGRLFFQYDHVQDHLGRDVRGIPEDLGNDGWTVRLQVEF